MNKQTFEESVDKQYKKEYIEWLRLWCENTSSELPRVALIGDSITEQVYEGVKKALQGIASVDFLATSYSITSPAYTAMVKAFVADSDYALICYNYGLHAFNVSIEEYEAAYRNMLVEFLKKSKVLIGATTAIHNQGLDITTQIIEERNDCAKKLAKEFGLEVDGGYEISVEMGKDGKTEDGVHFNEMGIKHLVLHKSERLKMLLQ